MLDIPKFIEGLHDYIGKAFKPIVERLKALESRAPPADGKDGEDGTSVTLEDVRPLVKELVAEIPTPKDGRDGEPGKSVTLGEISILVQEAALQLPVAQDGKDGRDGEPGSSVTFEDVWPTIDKKLSAAIEGLSATVEAIPRPLDGKDGAPGVSVELDDVRPIVKELVDAIPVPKDGKDGRSVTLDDVRPLVKELVDAIPVPKDGKDGAPGESVTVEQVLIAMTPMIEKALEAIPAPKDGRDGKDITVEDVLPALKELVATIPTPRDGKDGRDGESVTIEQLHELLETRVAKWALDFERRAMDLLQRCADKIPLPKDGKDGVGFDDLDFVHDGERTFTLRFVKGDVVKEFKHKVAGILLEKGIYDPAKTYERGDCVTYAGSYWVALVDTTKRPGDNNGDWRLVVKKGRDGKDGAKGERGPPSKGGSGGGGS